jgi:lysozyme
LKTNADGLKLIKHFEGLRLKAYYDPAGVLTIGYGTTERAGIGAHIHPGMAITEKQAEAWLIATVEKIETMLDRYIDVPVNGNQYSALVSFVYNEGIGNFSKSTLRRKLNAGDYAGAANEFPKWRKAGGKVLAGLVRRRAAERELFLK